jgi:hypothetical protein
MEITLEEKRLLAMQDESQNNIKQPDFKLVISLIAIDNFIHQALVNTLAPYIPAEQLIDLARSIVRKVTTAMVSRSVTTNNAQSYDDKILVIMTDLYGYRLSHDNAMSVIHSAEMAVSQAIVEACPEFDCDPFDNIKTYSFIDSKSILIELYFKR